MGIFNIFKTKGNDSSGASLIFKTKDSYKIITESRTKAGFLLSGEPVFIIPLDSPLDSLEFAMFESLRNSKKNVPVPKRDEYHVIEKKIVQKINEKSYNSLYKKANGCSIRCENESVKIFPLKFFNPNRPSQGLDLVEEDMFEIQNFEDNKRKITEKVIELLKKNYKTV